ncbi:MAG: hypothetical protein IJU76_08970 [Desulfovibrionaceae bacterium]|nr:hypothetical protein [Desulfovibrionaceae bacterium]
MRTPQNENDGISVLRSFEGGVGSFMTTEEIKEYESRHRNHSEKCTPINTEAFLEGAKESFKAMPLSMVEQH